MVKLEEVSQLLYGAGEEVVGWEDSQEDLISLVATEFPMQSILRDEAVDFHRPQRHFRGKGKTDKARPASRDTFRS